MSRYLGILAAAGMLLAVPSVSAHRDPDWRREQRSAQVMALSKKQRVREQIRARRSMKGTKS